MEDNNFNESEVARELEASEFTPFFNSFLCAPLIDRCLNFTNVLHVEIQIQPVERAASLG